MKMGEAAPRQSSDWLSALRGYGPAIAALGAAMLGTGAAGTRALLVRLRGWRVDRRLLLAALALPILVNLLVLLFMRLGAEVPLGLVAPQGGRLYLAFFVFAIVDGPLGEEIGWRGYLLPLLLTRTTALRASLVVGLAWYVWHLPLYAADGRALTGEFLITYLVSVVSIAVIFTWFFVRSNGNVWLAVLLHTTTNYFQYATVTLFPTLRGTMTDNRAYVVLMALVAVGAAAALRRDRRTSS
jgi:membrane protease YdiL (CAAX protease family)